MEMSCEDGNGLKVAGVLRAMELELKLVDVDVEVEVEVS